MMGFLLFYYILSWIKPTAGLIQIGLAKLIHSMPIKKPCPKTKLFSDFYQWLS
ncbi:hypothetical protein AO364_1740 [Moraxella catarrhalis]|nr:hypothetical protein AO376_1269 [Moraxella catarrhalis]OAV16777.1 hypothetical protein AO374_1312 [Moraxella catarrhalis]OAV34355.1 hypothetical protein AO364_1740 [Moraxella catarrhalis]